MIEAVPRHSEIKEPFAKKILNNLLLTNRSTHVTSRMFEQALLYILLCALTNHPPHHQPERERQIRLKVEVIDQAVQ